MFPRPRNQIDRTAWPLVDYLERKKLCIQKNQVSFDRLESDVLKMHRDATIAIHSPSTNKICMAAKRNSAVLYIEVVMNEWFECKVEKDNLIGNRLFSDFCRQCLGTLPPVNKRVA